jgi:hypothetical protein
MKKQSVIREYNFPDAELYTQCLERILYIKRDLIEFKAYAYGEEKILAFEKMVKSFGDLPDDNELVGDQMLATQKKNDAAEALKTAIRTVMTRVTVKIDAKSGRYRKFGTHKMNDMSDANLLLCGLRVARVSEQLLPFLEESGLKQELIDRVRQSTKAFENAIHIQQDKVADRDIAVEKRVEIGNDIYREFVMICNIGKDIWAEKNHTKYENYTIYESNNEQKKIGRKKAESAN